ncbi:hypothetical protein LIER_24910 [Lithospermum erythrorhizon]|uniref:Uncharacterized protein n=1 Tax=Lithospermum erythrorhizon TaxID=34254 RepID=A0AAV3R2Z7_LITER
MSAAEPITEEEVVVAAEEVVAAAAAEKEEAHKLERRCSSIIAMAFLISLEFDFSLWWFQVKVMKRSGWLFPAQQK